jgi:hypothetical protein
MRTGTVLVDQVHDDPGGLIPAHRGIVNRWQQEKLTKGAVVLARHLDDSEFTIRDIVGCCRELSNVSTDE